MAEQKCYAVKHGKMDDVIVDSWGECFSLVDGVPGASYKKFSDRVSAERWLKGGEESENNGCVLLYTDGSCTDNPGGSGGWAYVVIDNGEEFPNSGGEAHTTNNRMELLAFYNGIKFILETFPNRKIKVFTDSKYLYHGVTNWMYGWAKNNWMRDGKKEVLNVDIWKGILNIVAPHKDFLSFSWVKGHNGNKYNELCDKLAREQAFSFFKNKDKQETEITNYMVFKAYSKTEMAKLFASNKFKNFLLQKDALSIAEMLDEPAKDWGVDG